MLIARSFVKRVFQTRFFFLIFLNFPLHRFHAALKQNLKLLIQCFAGNRIKAEIGVQGDNTIVFEGIKPISGKIFTKNQIGLPFLQFVISYYGEREILYTEA